MMSSFILYDCCWRSSGLVSKGASYWVWDVFIASLRHCLSVWSWDIFYWRWFVCAYWTGAQYGSCLIPVWLRLTSLRISCRRSISWVLESVSEKWCFCFAKVTASSYAWDKEYLFQFRIEPRDRIMNLLLFGQLQMTCQGIDVIYVRF